MSGRRISVIVRLEVNRRRELILPRTIIWPTLRGWPDDFRGYLKQTFASDFEPPVLLDGKEVHPGHAPLRRMHFDGILTVEHASLRGVRAFGHAFDLEIQRESARHLRLTVQHQDGPTRTDVAPEGQAVQVAFG